MKKTGIFLTMLSILAISGNTFAQNSKLDAKLQEFDSLMTEMNSPSKPYKNVDETNAEISMFTKKIDSILRELAELSMDPNQILKVKAGEKELPLSPLILALMFENLPLARDLIKQGALVDKIISNYSPLLVAAVKTGPGINRLSAQERYDITKELLEAGADKIINYQYEHGVYILSLLTNIMNDDQKIPLLELLLSFGADPNLKSEIPHTPLQNAVRNRNFKATKLLLKNNANPNMTGGSQRIKTSPPLFLAIDTMLEEEYLSATKRKSPSAEGSKIFSLLLCNNADINGRDKKGNDLISHLMKSTGYGKEIDKKIQLQVQKLLEDFNNNPEAFCAEFAE